MGDSRNHLIAGEKKQLPFLPCAKRIRAKLAEKKLRFGGDEAEPVLGRSLIDVFASLKNGNVSSYEKFKRAFYAAINDGEKMCAYSIAYIDSSKSKAHASSGNKRRSPRLIEGNTRGVRRTLMP